MRTFYEEWSFLSVSNIAENNKDIVLAPAGAKSEELKKALPDIESLKKLLESDGMI